VSVVNFDADNLVLKILYRCVVTARFSKGKKELEVSCFQALVLMCFNDQEKLDINFIRWVRVTATG
jgi:hypothetical protein